jgi:hypothetical protein
VAQILPFSAWRFDLSQIGALADVLAPADTQITPELRRALYRLHPCNVIRLVDRLAEPGDASPADGLRRAGEYFRLWRREGILRKEHEDAFYALQLITPQTHHTQERWSLLGLVKPELEPGGLISPHCLAEPSEADIQQALQLRLAAEGDFLPAHALAADSTPDPETSLDDLLQQLVRQLTPTECWCEDGSRWKLWPLSSPAAIARIHAHLSHCHITVISGAEHVHAAARQQQLIAASGQPAGPRDPASCTLLCITDAANPGLPANPAAVTLSNTHIQSSQQLQDRAARILGVVCRFVGNEPHASADALELVPLNDEQPCLAVGTPDGHWHLLSAPARCPTAIELLQLLQHQLPTETPADAQTVPPENVSQTLLHPHTLVLAAPSPWNDTTPLTTALNAALPAHCQLLPPTPVGLVLSAHTNVTGRSQ